MDQIREFILRDVDLESVSSGSLSDYDDEEGTQMNGAPAESEKEEGEIDDDDDAVEENKVIIEEIDRSVAGPRVVTEKESCDLAELKKVVGDVGFELVKDLEKRATPPPTAYKTEEMATDMQEAPPVEDKVDMTEVDVVHNPADTEVERDGSQLEAPLVSLTGTTTSDSDDSVLAGIQSVALFTQRSAAIAAVEKLAPRLKRKRRRHDEQESPSVRTGTTKKIRVKKRAPTKELGGGMSPASPATASTYVQEHTRGMQLGALFSQRSAAIAAVEKLSSRPKGKGDQKEDPGRSVDIEGMSSVPRVQRPKRGRGRPPRLGLASEK